MDCRALLPHELPHTTPLTRDFTENFSRLEGFYAHKPELPSVEAYARQLDFPQDRRAAIAAILRKQNLAFGCSPETEKNLQRLENGAVAIVSGQQVGLFGGPAYAFYKALTAIESARELSLSGVESVPIFWMATEDHDVDEVRHATWFDDGKLTNLALPAPEEEGRPVGKLQLGNTIETLLGEIKNMAGPGSGEIFELLRSCCSPQDTYGTAFGKLFTKLFSPLG